MYFRRGKILKSKVEEHIKKKVRVKLKRKTSKIWNNSGGKFLVCAGNLKDIFLKIWLVMKNNLLEFEKNKRSSSYVTLIKKINLNIFDKKIV